jgi:FlaA1/EpsC-like NDP-sugar epimerase
VVSSRFVCFCISLFICLFINPFAIFYSHSSHFPHFISSEPEKFRVFSWRTFKILSLASTVSTAAFVGLCMALTEEQFKRLVFAMPFLIGLAVLGAVRKSFIAH